MYRQFCVKWGVKEAQVHTLGKEFSVSLWVGVYDHVGFEGEFDSLSLLFLIFFFPFVALFKVVGVDSSAYIFLLFEHRTTAWDRMVAHKDFLLICLLSLLDIETPVYKGLWS